MQFQKIIGNVFDQLTGSLEALTENEYTKPCTAIFKASIGQHVRHILELYICLYQGYDTGFINYEKRKRDLRIETDKDFAIALMQMIVNNMSKPNKAVSLVSNYDEQSEEEIIISTNYHRELLYNLEHTVHHMALIRVAINEVSAVVVPESFGVAASTIKYRKTCAQ